MTTEPTTAELKEAFNRSGLWRRGKTYQHAISAPAVLRSLINDVLAHRKKQPTPLQPQLFEETA